MILPETIKKSIYLIDDNKPVTRMEAWILILSSLKDNEFTVTISELSKLFLWDRFKLYRYLEALERKSLILLKKENQKIKIILPDSLMTEPEAEKNESETTIQQGSEIKTEKNIESQTKESESNVEIIADIENQFLIPGFEKVQLCLPEKSEIKKNPKQRKHKENICKREGDIKLLGDEDKDYIDKIISCFAQEYKKEFEIDYIILNGKDRQMAGKLLTIYKKYNKGKNSEETLNDIREFFKKCLKIEDKFIRDNMSLSIIINQYNKILKLINQKSYWEQLKSW